MRSNRLLASVLVSMVAVALTGSFLTAEAQPRRGPLGGGQDRGPEPIEHMAERLDLTAEQRARIEAFHEKNEGERLKIHKQMMQLELQIEGEWLEDEPSERELKNLARQLGELRNQMQLRRIEHRLAMREVLTDEQWDKLLTSRGGPHHRHRAPGPMGRGHGNPEAGNWRDR